MSEPFIAEIRMIGFNFAPRGWAFCNGQLLPVAQNTALFSLLGTIYGGDGRTTLALPDLRGRAPMHHGTGAGLTTRRIGQRAGQTTVTLTQQTIPSHNHPFLAVPDQADQQVPSSARSLAAVLGSANRGTDLYSETTATKSAMATEVLATSGSGQSHTNEQPFLGINFIIALVGVFPSRS